MSRQMPSSPAQTPSSAALRRSPRKRTPQKKQLIHSDQPFFGRVLGSPSSRTRSALEQFGSDPVRITSASLQLADITTGGDFAAFPSSPTRFDWDDQRSTPDWYQLMVPELPEEEPEDEEYHPEEEEDEEEEEEDPGTVAEAEEWQFDLEELLRDAQQEIVLPLQEEDDDDTEYEPDEDDEEDNEDDIVFDPSEFDLEELLRDAEQEVPVLPKPLTELMEDLESDDEDYHPDSGGVDEEDEEDYEDEETPMEYDPLDFDIEALLRDAQQELMNPYTPQAQERMEQEMIQASSGISPVVARRMSMVTNPTSSPLIRRHSVHERPVHVPSPMAISSITVPPQPQPQQQQHQQQQQRQYIQQRPPQPPSTNLSVKDLLSLRRDQMRLQKEAKRRQQLSQLPIWAGVAPALEPRNSSYMPIKYDFIDPTIPRVKVNAKNVKGPHNAGTTTKDIGIVEECPHCDRVFRGPKSSTHKQQHIKRKHPDNYVRKKGGKRVEPGQRVIQFVNS